MSESLFATLAEATAGHQGLRRTALFLHGLHPVDRDLLMKSIPVDQRHCLAELLKELSVLAITPTTARESLATAHKSASSASIVRSANSIRDEIDADWLSCIDAQAIGTVLTSEPDALIARVLRLLAPPRRARILDVLGSDCRARVSELLLDANNQHRYYTRLDAALLTQLRSAVERGNVKSTTLDADVSATKNSHVLGWLVPSALRGFLRRGASRSLA